MENPELVRLSQPEGSRAEITAHLPSKEALKAMFTLLVGNPDSMIKIFNKPMIVDKNDIDKLDEQVCGKLGIHEVEASKTTFDLTLSDNTILQFERWRGAEVQLGATPIRHCGSNPLGLHGTVAQLQATAAAYSFSPDRRRNCKHSPINAGRVFP